MPSLSLKVATRPQSCSEFGYDKNKDPVVGSHVTAPQARRTARENGLTGYFLAPHWSEVPNNGGMRAYRWDAKKGDYEDWNMRAWEFTYHLDPMITGTGLEDKPRGGPVN